MDAVAGSGTATGGAGLRAAGGGGPVGGNGVEAFGGAGAPGGVGVRAEGGSGSASGLVIGGQPGGLGVDAVGAGTGLGIHATGGAENGHGGLFCANGAGHGAIGHAGPGPFSAGILGKQLTGGYAGFFDGNAAVAGIATLDSNGEAWVELPDWCEALNRDFRYQLTAIGKPAPGLFIADEASRNGFRIAGGPAGARVSWLLTGIRKDPVAWCRNGEAGNRARPVISCRSCTGSLPRRDYWRCLPP